MKEVVAVERNQRTEPSKNPKAMWYVSSSLEVEEKEDEEEAVAMQVITVEVKVMDSNCFQAKFLLKQTGMGLLVVVVSSPCWFRKCHNLIFGSEEVLLALLLLLLLLSNNTSGTLYEEKEEEEEL